MKYSRLTNIAVRNRHYGVADLGLPTGLLFFTLAGFAILWSL
jgi:hypothetical protein